LTRWEPSEGVRSFVAGLFDQPGCCPWEESRERAEVIRQAV
jgi:hypothetical protein